MQEYIKVIGDEALSRVPENFDLTPYRDFHDTAELKQMRARMAPCANVRPRHRVHIAGLQPGAGRK